MYRYKNICFVTWKHGFILISNVTNIDIIIWYSPKIKINTIFCRHSFSTNLDISTTMNSNNWIHMFIYDIGLYHCNTHYWRNSLQFTCFRYVEEIIDFIMDVWLMLNTASMIRKSYSDGTIDLKAYATKFRRITFVKCNLS